MARANCLHLHISVTTISQTKRMQQARGCAEIYAGQQRQIVIGLQQAEMIADGFFTRLLSGKAGILCNFLKQGSLQRLLLHKELVEQRQLVKCNRCPVRMFGQ